MSTRRRSISTLTRGASADAASAGETVAVVNDAMSGIIFPGTVNNYLTGWGMYDREPNLETVFKKCREQWRQSHWLRTILALKRDVYLDGLKWGPERPSPAMRRWLKKNQAMLYRLAREWMDEWLLSSNVAVLWLEGDDVAQWMVPYCENIKYKRFLGAESVELKVGGMKLTDSMTQKLGQYAAAVGRNIPWGSNDSEHFSVVTSGRGTDGMAMPGLFNVFQELAALELIRKGEFNAAWKMKDVIRHYRRGHEIKSGNLAGQPTHFLKGKQAKKIEDALKNKEGAFDLITNFDVEIGFAFLDPKYFDDAKTKGIMARLRDWAGPLALLLDTNTRTTLADGWFKLLEADVLGQRRLFTDSIQAIFESGTFFKGRGGKAPQELEVRLSPNTLLSMDKLIEKVRLAGGQGYASPQTLRSEMGYTEAEADLMREAHKDPLAYTPPFEAKQGMVADNKGGRPKGTPASAEGRWQNPPETEAG